MQCIYTIGGIMQDLGFWFINDIVWHKTNPTPNFKGTRLNNAHETMIWATKSRDAKYTFNYKVAKELNKDTVSLHEHESGVRKQMGSVWRFPVCNGGERLRDAQGKKLHPTQKPEGILYRIINICSNLGDTVFDPFGGTMTTAKVAKQCGRGYISIERDAMYYEHGLARVDATEPVITNIERATFDKKPPRAIFADLIEREYLHKGERLFMRRKSDKSVVLQADGRIKLECGNLMDIHKGAAVFLGGRREKVNGYDYWAVLRDGKLTSIDEIRKKYRERELGYVYEEVA
jgi:site-specific DNA-methyltransferase (adenine-specific)